MREIIFLNEITAQTKHELKKYNAWENGDQKEPMPEMSDGTVRYIAGQNAGKMLAKGRKLRGMSGEEYKTSDIGKEDYVNPKNLTTKQAEEKKNEDAQSFENQGHLLKTTGQYVAAKQRGDVSGQQQKAEEYHQTMRTAFSKNLRSSNTNGKLSGHYTDPKKKLKDYDNKTLDDKVASVEYTAGVQREYPGTVSKKFK